MQILSKSGIAAAVWLAATLAITGCSDKSAVSHVMADESPSEVGAGINDLSGSHTATCFSASPAVDTGPILKPEIRVAANVEALAAALGLQLDELEAKAGSNPLAQLAKTAEMHPRLRYVVMKLKRATATEEIPTLKLQGQSEGQDPDVGVAKNYKTQYGRFVASCGDRFVSKIQRGDALYGLIPVLLNGPEQERLLNDDVNASRVDPKTMFPKLAAYATLGVQSLYVGATNVSKNLTVTQFQEEFQSRDGRYADANTQAIITYETKAYKDVITLPVPSPDQAKRTAYVSAYSNLNVQSLKADECIKRHTQTLTNPVEFISPDLVQLQTQKQSLTGYLEELDARQLACFQDECLNGICAVNDCSTAGLDTQLQTVVQQCDDTHMPKPATLDAFIYRHWKNQGGLTGALGAMQSLTDKIGDSVAQKFVSAYAVRPSASTNTLVITMKPLVVDRWKTVAAQLGEPLVQNDRELSNKARVVSFTNGVLYDFSAYNGSSTVRAVYNLASYLGDSMPAEDEKVIVNDDMRGIFPTLTKSSQLALEGGSVMFYYFKFSPFLPSAPSVATLWGSGALMEYFKSRGGLSWSVPIVSETKGGVDPETFFFGASNGNYYHWNNIYQMKEISAAMHQIYMGAGGAQWYGRIRGDEICNGSTCSLDTEGGVITRAQFGGIICSAGYEPGGGGSICQRVSCGINYGTLRRYGDTWDVAIANGSIKKQCMADKTVQTQNVSCNGGFQRSGESCFAASCGNTPSGSNYTVTIGGGRQTYRCDAGTGTYLSTSCDAEYKKSGRNCIVVAECHNPRIPGC